MDTTHTGPDASIGCGALPFSFRACGEWLELGDFPAASPLVRSMAIGGPGPSPPAVVSGGPRVRDGHGARVEGGVAVDFGKCPAVSASQIRRRGRWASAIHSQ